MSGEDKETLFPLSRVKIIMGSSEANDFSTKAVVLVAKAAEQFVAHFARQAWEASDSSTLEASESSTLEYSDLANLVDKSEKYAFLKDFIPQKITGIEYLKVLKKVLQEELENEI